MYNKADFLVLTIEFKGWQKLHQHAFLYFRIFLYFRMCLSIMDEAVGNSPFVSLK